MMFEEKRTTGPIVQWSAGKPSDAIATPSDETLLTMLEHYGFKAEKGEGVFAVVAPNGDAVELSYDATLDEWESAAQTLAKHVAASRVTPMTEEEQKAVDG